MRALLILAVLAGCSADSASNQKLIVAERVLCRVDAAAQPVAVDLVAPVAVTMQPAAAGAVQMAVAVDEAAHAALQAACPNGAVIGVVLAR